MYELADAHLHLFKPGFTELLPASCRREAPDELTLYNALAKRTGVVRGLVIGFEGMPEHVGNNEYLREILPKHPHLHGTAYVIDPAALTLEMLEGWNAARFCGLSFYLLDSAAAASIAAVPDACWRWIEQRRWMISVNSRGELWNQWQKILDRYPELRLLMSHLGSPPPQTGIPTIAVAENQASPVIALARYPRTHVKVSALYSISQPGFAYPHRAAWPFVEVALRHFGESRLLWGSDYSPSLEYVSFDQTWGVLDEMPFLSTSQKRAIAGANLLSLISEVA